MKTTILVYITAFATGAVLSGCANNPSQPYYGADSTAAPTSASRYGYVEKIEVVQRGAGRNVAGTVIGGIVGGIIGNQIGSGRGQTAATIAGAVGGGVAGNQIEKRSREANETFRITVRLENGELQTVTEDNISDLRTGDRVRIEAGRLYRT